MKNTIKCELCGLECSMQIPRTHLEKAHGMTTKEYKSLGYQTLSPARLEQLQKSPVGSGKVGGSRDQHGEKHWNWKGGHTTGNGYRITYRNGRRDYEHRLVAEETIGRLLKPDEIVHHIDGNRSNNSPENLVVMTAQEHNRTDIKTKVKQFFHINKECEEAAHALKKLGWSISKIRHALRVEYRTVSNWLKSD